MINIGFVTQNENEELNFRNVYSRYKGTKQRLVTKLVIL